MAPRRTRRRFLAGGAATALAGLAGCSTSDSPKQGHRKDPSSGSSDGDGVDGDGGTTDATRGSDDGASTLLGAHYYPWYGTDPVRHWDETIWGEPTLGEYDARAERTVERHLSWAQTYGIDWLSVAWWGPGSYSDETMREHLMGHRLADATSFSVLYETTGRLGDLPVDLDSQEPRDQLVSDFEYLSEQLFGEENYLRIGGRPVVFVYVARGFEGDVTGAFEAARSAIDEDPYVIADLGLQPESVSDAYDAVSRYDVYSRADSWSTVFDRNLSGYRQWSEAAAAGDFAFVPAVSPGFNDPDSDFPVLERSPEQFRRFCEEIPPLLDDDLQAALVTTFNEWHEGTVIEPGHRPDGHCYETTYLEILRETLASAGAE